uniref:Uncharacterized protein n=1 Tax=Babesia bovis TaxID=5865 RepID=S6B1W2_BABBO|nr:hypothetical protein [Babesia bovis]
MAIALPARTNGLISSEHMDVMSSSRSKLTRRHTFAFTALVFDTSLSCFHSKRTKCTIRYFGSSEILETFS